MKKCRWFSSGFLWSSWRPRLRPTLQPSSEGERRTWLRIELRPFASPFGGKVGLTSLLTEALVIEFGALVVSEEVLA